MKKILVIVSLLIAAINTAMCPMAARSIQESPENIYLDYRIAHEPISAELLWLVIQREGIEGDSIVFAQALHETGKFKSYLFRHGNNLFGMRVPAVRKSLTNGKLMGYATYKSWVDSVKDYKLFQDYYLQHGYDLTNYSAFLSRIGYAEDPMYLILVDRLIKEYA